MESRERPYWSRLLRTVRAQQGMTQRALAERLDVNQATISRWERGCEEPSLKRRRRIRDLLRNSSESAQDRLLKMRVQYSAWPTSLVRKGAVFIATSPSLAGEVGADGLDEGACIYGRFGAEADERMAQWERAGIFAGELAMTISLNRIMTPQGEVFFRGLDTPYTSSSGEIWCLCEIHRLTQEEYAAHEKQLGGVLVPISYDALH